MTDKYTDGARRVMRSLGDDSLSRTIDSDEVDERLARFGRACALAAYEDAAYDALLKRDVFINVSSVPTMERDLQIRARVREEIASVLMAKAADLRREIASGGQ